MNLGYRFQQDILKQYDGSFAWPIAGHWNTVGRWVYSLQDRQTIEQLAGFEYKSCCWRFQVVQRRYRHQPHRGTRYLDCITIGTDGLKLGRKACRCLLVEGNQRVFDARPRCPIARIHPMNPIFNEVKSTLCVNLRPFVVVLIAAILLLPPARAQTRDIGVHGELLDRIAAIVNDGLVLKSELDAQMDAVTKRLQEQKVELPSQSVLRQQVLDRLILQEIQAQRAKRVGLTISDEQLNGALQEIAQRNKIPFDQLPTALAAQGIDYKQYRESMRKELTLSTLRQRDVIAHINVTPHELEQFLARQQSSAANDEFNVSHILLSLPSAATPQQLDEISHKAQDLAARAAKGEDFGQLAIANSNSQTALDGGQLGLAQRHSTAAIHSRSRHQDEARRSERARAHAERLSHRETQ